MTSRDGKRTFVFALLTSASIATLPMVADAGTMRSEEDFDPPGELTEFESLEGGGNLQGMAPWARLAPDLTRAIGERLQSALDEAAVGPVIWAETYSVRVNVTGMPEGLGPDDLRPGGIAPGGLAPSGLAPGGFGADSLGNVEEPYDALLKGGLLEGWVYIDAPDTELPLRKYRIALTAEHLAQFTPGDCRACYEALVNRFAENVVRDVMRLSLNTETSSRV